MAAAAAAVSLGATMMVMAGGMPAMAAGSGTPSTLHAYVNGLMKRPTKIVVPALPKAPPKGGTIDFIACGAPTCQEMGEQVKQATSLIGWKFVEIQAGLTSQAVSTAYDQAVHNHPTGVIGSGSFSPKIMSHQLKELRAEGSTPILISVPSPGEASGAILTTSTEAEYGREMGAWIALDAKGKTAHVLVVTTPSDPIFATLHAALKKTMDAHCTGCTMDTYDYPDTAQAATLPTLVTTYVRSHPSINYVFFDFANSVAGVPSALQAAGLENQVKIVTTTTSPAESEYLIQGKESASAAIPWPEMLWGTVNAILRAKMKLPLGPALNAQFPNMILTGKNLPPGATTTMFPLVANFKTAYKTAWHLGS